MSKFGPTRGEWIVRLLISLIGLALLVAAIAIRGWPQGPALFEVIGIAGVFFGGSAIWAGYKLWSR